MPAFDYSASPYPVRDDLPAAYKNYWQKLAQPGNWWSGAERVAIAEEVRNAPHCEFCKQRKASLSPYQFPGEHDHSGKLHEAVVDAVHRIITDQNRITGKWIEQLAKDGISDGHFVELLGVTVTVFSIDEFNRGLGLPLEPLPEPMPGEPDGYRPASAVHDTGHVAMVPSKGPFSERESGMWPPGRSANVLRALSLVPDAVRDWSAVAGAQYLSLPQMTQFSGDLGRSIDRMQMEVVAGRVSSHNECFY